MLSQGGPTSRQGDQPLTRQSFSVWGWKVDVQRRGHPCSSSSQHSVATAGPQHCSRPACTPQPHLGAGLAWPLHSVCPQRTTSSLLLAAPCAPCCSCSCCMLSLGDFNLRASQRCLLGWGKASCLVFRSPLPSGILHLKYKTPAVT